MLWSSGERRAARRGALPRALRARSAAADVAAVVAAIAFGATVRLLVPRDGVGLSGLRGKLAALANTLSPLSCSTYPPGVDDDEGEE